MVDDEFVVTDCDYPYGATPAVAHHDDNGVPGPLVSLPSSSVSVPSSFPSSPASLPSSAAVPPFLSHVAGLLFWARFVLLMILLLLFLVQA